MVARPRSPHGALIPQFYAGRNIFITGATGFLGKVLIERLLSTCPDVGNLHLLMRSKKGVSPETRLQQLKQSQVFGILRQTNPSQLDKLKIIPGDVSQPNLGITVDYLQKLYEISIVFHAAATLKFDERLECAVAQNILSVIRLMDICDTLPNVEAFIHVSTAYSNAELARIEEKVYPPPASLSKLLSIVDVVPTEMLQRITSDYISPKPNTYIFTKAMAEEAVRSRTSKKYPIAIFRPTIVVSSLHHPFPGWVENLNGPSGVTAAAGKGLLHVFRLDQKKIADLLPVDIAVDTMIAVGWETAVEKLPTVRVYNCSTCANPTTWLDFEKGLKIHLRSMHPLDNAVWYPSGTSVKNRYIHTILEFLLNTLPLHVAEHVLKAVGIKLKINLITAAQKMQAMSKVLTYFGLRDWYFYTDNVMRLKDRLTPQDRAIYNLDPMTIDWDKHMEDFVKGTRRYILKEKDEKLPDARRRITRLYYIHKCVMSMALILFIRVLLQNRLIREFVYGGMRIMLSIMRDVYTSIMGPI